MLTDGKLKEIFIATLGVIFIFIIAGTVTALTLHSLWTDESDPAQGVNVQWFNQSEVRQDHISLGCFNNSTNFNLYLFTEDRLKNLQLTGAFLQTVTFEFYKERKKTPLLKVGIYFPGINAARNHVGSNHGAKVDEQADLEKEKLLKDTMALDVWCGTDKDPMDNPAKSGISVSLRVVKKVVYYNLKIPLSLVGTDDHGKILLKLHTTEIDNDLAKRKLEELGMGKKKASSDTGDSGSMAGIEPSQGMGGGRHHHGGMRGPGGEGKSKPFDAISFTGIIFLASP